MNKHFYMKMALQNIRKNKRIYVPFILASVGMTTLYCIFAFMAYNTGLDLVRGGDTVKIVLGLGCRVMEIFSVIFLFYTNSFLIKQRKKELGLYCVLGMEKRHVAKILSRETLLCGGTAIIGGIVFGVLFSKVCYVILLRLLGNGVVLGFMAPGKAIGRTILVFTLLFLAVYIYNSSCIKMIHPSELLQSGKKGEAEPKAKWLRTLISLGMLGGGYYLAISCGSPISAINEFFIAVLLVIGGTYGLFTSVIVAVLKLLQKKKSYYYKTKHFVAVSGLMYRMKRNAVSLANICILSTAVLVMVSTTVTIYAKIEGEETAISVSGNWIGEEKTKALEKELAEVIERYGKKEEDVLTLKAGGAICLTDQEGFRVADLKENMYSSQITVLNVMDAKSFEESFGEKLSLQETEALVYVIYGETLGKELSIGDKTYKVREYRQDCPLPMEHVVSKAYLMIVPEEEQVLEISRILNGQEDFSEGDESWDWYLLPKLDKEGEIKLAGDIRSVVKEYGFSVVCGQEKKEDFIAVNGSLLFIGIFLGIVFMMATVLIIYYKQLTEGYEDCGRFQIMSKIGMSEEEVKSSVRSQVLLVFFLPVMMAGIHLLAASPCLKNILMLFQVMDGKFFAISTLATFGIFVLIYVCVYGVTARTYYHIVETSS